MVVFWCGTGPWLARPDIARRFCQRAGVPAGDFFSDGDLVPHAAGRYLLLRGFRRYAPGVPLPPLETSPNGKPRFAGGRPAFSISHAGGAACCAFGESELGVDLEEIAPLDAPPLSALRPEERAYLRRLPEGRRAAAFFQLWTRKESLLKARGGTLADLLRQESLLTPEGRWKERTGGFRVRGLPFPDPAYAAAVSAREDGPVLFVRLELPGEGGSA